MNLVIGLLFALSEVITAASIVYLIGKTTQLERRLRKLEDVYSQSDITAAE